MPFVIILISLHVWGRRKNKRKARGWITAHAPALEKEFAVVGFAGKRSPRADDGQTRTSDLAVPAELLKEKTAQEYTTYATGRQNVAFIDIKLSLYKRYNPMTLMLEKALSFLFESITPPVERMEATAYTFDGKERDLVPVRSKQELDNKDSRFKGLPQSTYDNFVWAVVHKERMKRLRDDRYDVSLTYTKDHSKLPVWATVMSESAEITDQLLTADLVKAIEGAGDAFEYLIVTDQPVDKPQKFK